MDDPPGHLELDYLNVVGVQVFISPTSYQLLWPEAIRCEMTVEALIDQIIEEWHHRALQPQG